MASASGTTVATPRSLMRNRKSGSDASPIGVDPGQRSAIWVEDMFDP